MAEIATTEPAKIIAGDTAKWLITLSDYSPANSWNMSYSFVSTGSKRVTVNATTSGTSFLTTISNAVTANMAPGTWYFQGRVNNASESYTVRTGQLEIEDNFGSIASVLDNRSHARKMLDLIEAALEGRAVDGIDSHTIGGVAINMIPLERLRVLRDQYKAEVLREEQADKLKRGVGGSRNIYVRFN